MYSNRHLTQGQIVSYLRKADGKLWVYLFKNQCCESGIRCFLTPRARTVIIFFGPGTFFCEITWYRIFRILFLIVLLPVPGIQCWGYEFIFFGFGSINDKEKVFQLKNVRFFSFSSVWSAIFHKNFILQHVPNPNPNPNFFSYSDPAKIFGFSRIHNTTSIVINWSTTVLTLARLPLKTISCKKKAR
jgi:hypothetical protein